jgi:hypothetical protein
MHRQFVHPHTSVAPQLHHHHALKTPYSIITRSVAAPSLRHRGRPVATPTTSAAVAAIAAPPPPPRRRRPLPECRASAAAGEASTSTAAALRVFEPGSSAEALLDGIDTLIFDCDGVLWMGSALIPNAPEVRVRAAGPAERAAVSDEAGG